MPSANQYQNLALWVGAVIVLAYIMSEMAARLTRLALSSMLGGEDTAAFRSLIVRRPIRLVRALVFLLILAAGVPPAMELAGISLGYGLELGTVTYWLARSGLRVGLIMLIAYVAVHLVATLVQRFEENLANVAGMDALERAKRARTLGNLTRNVLDVLIVSIATLMVLRELAIDIMPVLTGAGLVGLAIGFGAQALVKDIITGFFLILENQIRVGDVAIINGTGGLVEAVNLRTVVLRDLAGTVHIFPNGSIDRLSNMTRDFSFYVIDVGVAYKENVDEVIKTLREVGATLQNAPPYQSGILEPLEILGVDNFEESQVTIKIRIKTVPLRQWEIGRELRRRIKVAFDARGIEIPFPHRTIYYGRETAVGTPVAAAPR